MASSSVSKQKSSLLQVSSAAHVPLDPQTTPFLFYSGIQGECFYGKHQNTRFNHKWSRRSVAGDDFQQFETTWNHWLHRFRAQECIEFCKKNGAFDPKTMGACPNVGLMAQKVQVLQATCESHHLLPGCWEQPWTYFSVTSFVSPLDG